VSTWASRAGLRQGERRQSRRYCGEVSIKSGRVVGCRRGRLETSAVEERLRARAGLFGMTQHNTKIIDHIDLPARFSSYSGKKLKKDLCGLQTRQNQQACCRSATTDIRYHNRP
jgi:hypothetical protein